MKINKFQGEPRDISAKTETLIASWQACCRDGHEADTGIKLESEFSIQFCIQYSVLLFSKLNTIFFGYFDPENIFLDNTNKYFSG